MKNRLYLCIDLKSFFASVECVERGLDPLKTNLVVADSGRTEKTICLAVTPALKSYGLSGRARLFEVVAKVDEINNLRKWQSPNKKLLGKSFDITEINNNPSLEVSYIVAPPRMAYYSKYSTEIFNIYLKYVERKDILDYSIDEVFIDITDYIKTTGLTAREFAGKIIKNVFEETGITATAGIGTNMYLAKIAMDVKAKKMPEDENGVRIAELDEMAYRRELWTHTPLTDFWRVGKGTAKKLKEKYIYTMGDIARLSINENGEKLLYKMFGKNAELLIDHAWGYEPCTLKDVRGYLPENRSVSSGQVLHTPYTFDQTRIIVREMLELLALDLVEKRIVTDQIVITVGYDIDNLTHPEISEGYRGEITIDYYGRKVPKPAHGTVNLLEYTSSARKIIDKSLKLFDNITDRKLLVRRLNISANHILSENEAPEKEEFEQLDLFTDVSKIEEKEANEQLKLKKERSIQEATIEIRNKFGKNAILKGFNLKEGATTKERNRQIGGHKA